jgi:hypothetical protein
MRWPANASLDSATLGTAKSGQLHRNLTEQRRDRMVSIIFHTANTIATQAIWPPEHVGPRLRGHDLALDIRQEQLCLGQGQPQIGDITNTVRPADFQEVRAVILTLGTGFHQPQNPRHAPTPGPRTGTKLPNSPAHPQFRGAPAIKLNPTRKNVPPFDKAFYKGRNVIERAFSHLKDWRWVATRYDKLARNFRATATLALLFRWWI